MHRLHEKPSWDLNMMSLPVISSVVATTLPALTPGERWSAARRLESGFSIERWMIVVCVAALVVLVALLWWISMRRVKKERVSTKKSFIEYARQRGLSNRECQLLTFVANKAALKRPESIFAMVAAFDTGAAGVVEEAARGASPGDAQTAEESERLKTEITFLREKLGFGKKRSSSGKSSTGLSKVTTRQIPVGKKLYVTRRKARANVDIESTVVRNSDTELAVVLSQAVKIVFGEMWCVRYYSGASVWEFDTAVLSYDGDTLVLNHSDSVRFVNRRRFLRVSVSLRAFVARFPFMSPFDEAVGGGRDGTDLPEASGETWAPPRFVPAVVTEMAGPGLRIESALEVGVGERVLVVFGLQGEGSEETTGFNGDGRVTRGKMAEDIGEVRHVKAIEGVFSIAVELTGLSDSDVDELIQVANAVLVRAGATDRDAAALASEQQLSAEPSVAQGV